MQQRQYSSRLRNVVLLFSGLLMLALLSGCIKEGAVVVNCDPTGPNGPEGCLPLSPYTGSATNFRSIDGQSPVPASANKYCTAAGSWKCANENQANCSALRPTKVCKSHFYYTSNIKPAGFCECLCVNP